jgi:PAS domain S-box-containing protein
MHFKKSLRRRFIFTLIGVVTIILAIFSGVVIGYNYTKKEAELQQQLHRTLDLAETVLPDVVWRGNQQSIHNILRAILANDAVIYARVLVNQNFALSETKQTYAKKNFAEFQNSRDFLISSADVQRQGILLGKLQVVMSRSEIYNEISSNVFVVISLFVLLIMAILFTSMLILRYSVFTPLSKLERSANLIAAGNLDTTIDIDSRDEIGSLASAFRLMARRLEESFEDLEHKVIGRTVDLSQAKIAAEKTSEHLVVAGAEVQALLDNSPVGILFADHHGLIRRVNSELEKIIGYRSSELVGQTIDLLSGNLANSDAASAESFPRLNKNGLCERRFSLMRKDGSEVTCWLRGRAIPVSNDLEGVIWSVEDITSRIRMEDELLKAKKQESIGVLAGGIAHDFNNILFAVIGNLSLAERMIEETDLAREHIRAAQDASIRAKELTAKLLTFASGGDPVKAPASLPVLVRDAAEFVLSGSNVKCAFLTPDNLWPVSMDKKQISLVVQNLVRNALQSMPEGGTIMISFANRELEEDEVMGLSAGRYVRVSLADKGRGIAGDILDRVFDPYFSTKDKDSNKGSGLGLAIVDSIVKKHEGKITVDSIPGEGTTFILYLPARSVDSGNMAGRSAIIPSGKGVVLVLDADRGVQEVVRDMLLPMGYRAETVFNGQDAIRLYKESFEAGIGFCAVIVDMHIVAEFESRELISKLQAINPQVSVIGSSDDPDDPMLENCQEYGLRALIIKPFKLLELNRVMSSIYKKSGNALSEEKVLSLKN